MKQKNGLTRFGWCETNEHEACATSFMFYDKLVTCGCDCHKEESK